jgi:hypothetical protein
MACGGQKQGKPAGQNDAEAGEQQQRASIADERLEETLLVRG